MPSVIEKEQVTTPHEEEGEKSKTIKEALKRGNWKKKAIYAYALIAIFLSWTTFLFFRFGAESRLILLKAAIIAVSLPLMVLFSWLYLKKSKGKVGTDSEKQEGFFVKLIKKPVVKTVLAWIVYLVLIFLMLWLVPSTPKNTGESSQTLPTTHESADQLPEAAKAEEPKQDSSEAEETKVAATEEPEVTPSIQTAKLYIHVQSEMNLAFSTYDMEILYDGEVIGTVANGEHFTKLMDAETGKHEITIRNVENEEIHSKKTIEVKEDSTFKSLIKHDKSSITFTNTSTEAGVGEATLEMPNVEGQYLSVALDSLKAIGFVNVHQEPSGDIWDTSNWRVVRQDVAAGTVMDCNVRIQLDCISLNDFYNQQFTGKTVNEILQLAKEMGITVKFENESWKDITEEVQKMSEEEKNTWVAVKGKQYAFETTALVTIKNPNAPTPTPKPTATPRPSATPRPAARPMPVMPGTSLDAVLDAANALGLSRVYSDEDFGHGTKMCPLANSNGGLTLDVIYSTSTKEVLCASIVTFSTLSSADEQKAFIKAMAGVLCPSNDQSDVTKWVNSNVGGSAQTTINGFVYEVGLGPTGNYLYYAGERNWEEWDSSVH